MNNNTKRNTYTKLNEKKGDTASQKGDLHYAIANHKKILNIEI